MFREELCGKICVSLSFFLTPLLSLSLSLFVCLSLSVSQSLCLPASLSGGKGGDTGGGGVEALASACLVEDGFDSAKTALGNHQRLIPSCVNVTALRLGLHL